MRGQEMSSQRLGRLLPTGGLLVLVLLFGAGGCGDDDGAETPTPQQISTSVNPSPTTARPTATPSLEDQVLTAYADYWEVYAHALRDRDASRLDDVMTGPRLERGKKEINDLLEQRRAIALVVKSNPVVLQINGDQALVFDEYENTSYYADPTTKQPIGATPSTPEIIKDTVTMRRVDGVWKVFDGVREESAE